MDSKSTNAFALLDVMTCGLGGILLLFILVLSLKGTFKVEADPDKGKDSPENSGFVFLVSSSSRLEDHLFELEYLAPNSNNYEFKVESGRDFLFLSASTPPPAGSRLALKNVPHDMKISVNVLYEKGNEISIPETSISKLQLTNKKWMFVGERFTGVISQ